MKKILFILPLLLFSVACAKDEQVIPVTQEIRFEVAYMPYQYDNLDRWVLKPMGGEFQHGEFYTYNDMEIVNSWCTGPLRLNIYNLQVVISRDSNDCEVIETIQAEVGGVITLKKIFYDSVNRKFTTTVIQEIVLSKNMENDDAG